MQENLWFHVNQALHIYIAQKYQLYLSLPQVANSLNAVGTGSFAQQEEWPTTVLHYSFREYTIKYWHEHYKLIPKSLRPETRVSRFFQDRKLLRSWAEAFWWYSNPVTRSDRGFSFLLPVFAGFGLQDCVEEDLRLTNEMPNASHDRALALVEAARSAQLDVVRMLLAHGDYSQAILQEALSRGKSCNDASTLYEVIKHAAKSSDDFDWPPNVLRRAAELGFDKVVEKLVDFGVPIDSPDTTGGFTPLYLAVRAQRWEVVKLLLERNASITKVGRNQRMQTHDAAYHGDAYTLKLLLDTGADIQARDGNGDDAMDLACERGSHKAAKVLTKMGWKEDTTRNGGLPPLVSAATNGFKECCQILLENKVNVDAIGPQQLTALYCAAFNNGIDLCRLLLQYGADVNYCQGSDPILTESIWKGNLELVKLLTEGGRANVNATGHGGWTSLQAASSMGHTAIVRYLIEAGADPNHADEDCITPLISASAAKSTAAIRLLIDGGADLNHKSKKSWSAIHNGIEDEEMTRILMGHSADASHPGPSGTALGMAISNNNVEVVEVLLSFGSGLKAVNKKDDSGYTPLHVAIRNNYAEMARLLLEAGADINERFESYAMFPIALTVSRGQEIVLRVLMEYRPDLTLQDNDGDTAFHYMNSETPVGIVRLLINGGINYEIRSKSGFTPLCRAVHFENLPAVQYLIKKEAQVNIIGSTLGGPLHIACRQGNLDLIKALLAASADVNIVDPDIRTPLMAACTSTVYSPDTQESVVRYLINEAKADVKIIGGLRACALISVYGLSTPKVVDLILEQGAHVDVADEMGRMAIHFAASQSLANFDLIVNAGADINAKDNMGRTVLHWAVLSGLAKIVEHVISLWQGNIDHIDTNGWTPLLWAVRNPNFFYLKWRQLNQRAQIQMISLLLGHGADPCAVGNGVNREWTPAQVARYYGLDDEIVQLLLAKAKENLTLDRFESDLRVKTLNQSKPARRDQIFAIVAFW